MNAKLDTGRVFERIFKIYGEQFTLLIPAALVLFIPVAILNGLVLASGGGLALLFSSAIAVIATYWYQGIVVEAVVDILDGAGITRSAACSPPPRPTSRRCWARASWPASASPSA